ncbi:MAG: class I SAM-dependent methyltransferase [Anaerolineaceae bacterium]|nr:class I SAM-dependent methyltransferase [Anaerolineaceae bacterium]
MNQQTQNQLTALNDQFYQTFAGAFAATRMRLQPGIRGLMDEIPRHGNWLDLGCGNGALGKLWAEQQRKGSYIGLDFSDELLEHARQLTAGLETDELTLRYLKSGLTDDPWPIELADVCNEIFSKPSVQFDGILSFAALHHVPGAQARVKILEHVHRLLKSDGIFIHSEWQFQNSAKLMERRLQASDAGIDEQQLETGDTILDWRFSLPGQEEQVGQRYVHLFTEAELHELAQQSGFLIEKTWYSDGKSGNLALYQIWRNA